MFPFDDKTMSMLESFSDRALSIGLLLLTGLIMQVLATVLISGLIKVAVRRSETHRNATPTRATRLLAQVGLSTARTHQRTKALGSVLKSFATIAIWVTVLLSILNVVGVNLAPIIAAAGVGGVALGFGAQSLVKDFLAGICIMVEDQFGVGDFVEIGQIKGTIEEITLRVTRLRDPSGKVWYIRNGEILQVGNLSQGWSLALVDIPVDYNTDPDVVLPILQTICDELAEDPQWDDVLLEEPTVLGVESVARGSMTLRVSLKCAPNQNWAITRELRAKAKEAFDKAGVAGPQAFEI